MSRFSPRILLALFTGGYFATILVTTTAPLYLDATTVYYLTVGPLVFIILIGSYLIIRSLHLRGFLKLVAYFIAFIALVNIPSQIFAAGGSPQRNLPAPGGVLEIDNNSTIRWGHFFTNNCLLVAGQSSTPHSTGYQALAYGSATSSTTADCHGKGQITSAAYSSGVYASAGVDSSIWFQDQPFYVPPNSQRTTELYLNGNIHVSGWLVDHRAGLGTYDPNTSLQVEVKLVGDAPCNIFDCITNNWQLWSWTETQSMNSEYSIETPPFRLVPGYNYHIIVSFNASAATFGAGLGGIASTDTCFGPSPDCLQAPGLLPMVPTCASPTGGQSRCGLELDSLTYTLTSYS